MKKVGTLNSHLSMLLARMGHTDQLVVCDSGFPIPRDKEFVDLAVRPNLPKFADVVEVILQELQVEQAVVAEEMVTGEGSVYDRLRTLLGATPITTLTHEQFKLAVREDPNTAFVRTGEATPYANVILRSGVTFG